MSDALVKVVRAFHDHYIRTLDGHLAKLTLEEALFSDGGYRSILGVLKHLGGWHRVYYSYAFEADPRHWDSTTWPRGMRDEIDASREYVDEIIAWIHGTAKLWDDALTAMSDDEMRTGRPVHWGGEMPLINIVGLVCHHVAYHTGELNMLLSIAREEAWEWGEEVEENHIDTFGHGIRGPWMDDAIAKSYEDRIRTAREARLARKTMTTS